MLLMLLLAVDKNRTEMKCLKAFTPLFTLIGANINLSIISIF